MYHRVYNRYIYTYIYIYINLMVTTNQKSIIDTHTKKTKESKHTTKGRHQITREESKRKDHKRTI